MVKITNIRKRAERTQEKVKQLINNLPQEKALANPCMENISLLESQLNYHWDSEISREIENYSLFDHFNMEKMTPHFLKIAKCTKPDKKLTNIKNDNNTDFMT